MRRERTTGLASMALGVGIAVNSILGPLMLGVIRFRESANMETQLLGGELTSLYLAAPMAFIAGVLWWRGSRLAPAVGIGPAGYALYTYVQFVLVPDYARYDGNNERFFLLYLALVMVGGWLVWRAWHELWSVRIANLTSTVANAYGVLLLVVNGAFAIAWLASLLLVAIDGPTVEYVEHPTGFWLVRLMDLGFIIPFGVTTGIGLLSRAPWASRNAYAFAGTQALLACAVSGMAIRMWAYNDPASSLALLVVSTISAIALSTAYATLIGTVARSQRTTRCIELPFNTTRPYIERMSNGGSPPILPPGVAHAWNEDRRGATARADRRGSIRARDTRWAARRHDS